MTMVAECVLDCRDKLGEGIIWDAAEQVLWWVDLPMPSLIHRLDPASGEHRSWPCPEIVTAMSKRRDGTLLVASHHGLNIFDPADGSLKRVAAPEAHLPQNRANDGGTDPSGRFWYGTMYNNLGEDGSDIGVAESSGILYRVGADMVPVPMQGGIGIHNATCFAPDGRTMYFADTMADVIWAWDLDLELGAISNRRVFSDDTTHGHPDGATVDAEGYLWSARWEGSCVLRIAPDGTIDRKIDVPSARVTCCAFGGPDLDVLYITTSRANLPESALADTPRAGGLFAVRPGVKGIAAPQFAG